MTDKKWHSGPPPSLGWWPASSCRDDDSFRWWNGKYWSWGIDKHAHASTVQAFSQMQATLTGIKWQHRPKSWPDRSKT